MSSHSAVDEDRPYGMKKDPWLLENDRDIRIFYFSVFAP